VKRAVMLSQMVRFFAVAGLTWTTAQVLVCQLPDGNAVRVQYTLQDASAVFEQIMNSRVTTIPREIIQQSGCIVVVPAHPKAAPVKDGRGVFTCRTGNEWSAPGFITLRSQNSQTDIGSGDLVLVVKDKQALSSSKFTFGDNVTIADGPVDGAAYTADWTNGADVLTYSRSEGHLKSSDLAGVKVRYDRVFGSALYGRKISAQSVISGQLIVPAGDATDFIHTVGTADAPSFPWPPPEASAREVIPHEVLEAPSPPKSLGGVDTKLVDALTKNGYREKSYFPVPGGFALATRLEQIDSEGKSSTSACRWTVAAKQSSRFSPFGYLRALLTADTSCDASYYYRVIVFIVSDKPFNQAQRPLLFGEALEWLKEGLNVLPLSVANQPYNQNFATTVLIYEFAREAGKKPALDQPSRLGDGHSHLIKSGLWAALSGQH
jgi:lipid-binding SYLF domain-containing protein